jgi:hypothetical protein
MLSVVSVYPQCARADTVRTTLPPRMRWIRPLVHQDALRQIVKQVQDAGDLVYGLSLDDAAKIIFFYFRHEQFVLASDTFGWGVDRTVQWITERIESAILKA